MGPPGPVTGFPFYLYTTTSSDLLFAWINGATLNDGSGQCVNCIFIVYLNHALKIKLEELQISCVVLSVNFLSTYLRQIHVSFPCARNVFFLLFLCQP